MASLGRKRERKARDMARLLVALDAIAVRERPWRPGRLARLSLGSLR